MRGHMNLKFASARQAKDIFDFKNLKRRLHKTTAATIHSSIQLSPTPESDNSVNFLDLSITRNTTHLKIGIYRKPTTTDTTINFLPNHPLEHRMAAYKFLIRRMLTLPLDTEQQHNEWQQILHIALSNNIPQNMLTR